MNYLGDVLRDHGIGLGKYKIGSNIAVSNLNIPYVLFTFGEETQEVQAVDSLGNIYISDEASGGDNLLKYNSQLNQIWKSRMYPTDAINHPEVRKVVIGKDDTPWVQLYFQKSDFNYYMGFFRINKSTGAIEAGIDYLIGRTEAEYWNFAVDRLTADVLYIAECKVSTTSTEVRRTNVPSKIVDWKYPLGSGYSFAPPHMIAHPNGSLYVAARTGDLHRISTSNAALIYKKTVPLGDGLDVDTSGNAYVSGYNSNYQINSLNTSGVVRWTYVFGAETTSIALSRDDAFLYISSDDTGYVGDDKIDKINATTGSLIRRIRPAGRKARLVTSPNGDVYMTHINTVSTPVCLREVLKILN